MPDFKSRSRAIRDALRKAPEKLREEHGAWIREHGTRVQVAGETGGVAPIHRHLGDAPASAPNRPLTDTAVPHRFPTMDGRASSAGDPFETCTCGDLRHQHDHRGDCRICRAGSATWDNCLGFTLAAEVSR